MDQRTDLIKDVLRHSLSITHLCLRYNISRRTGYKWIERQQQAGLPGLRDRPRKPHTWRCTRGARHC